MILVRQRQAHQVVRSSTLLLLMAYGLGLTAGTAWADEPIQSGGAMTKLGRGFVNIVTGWVEIPKRMHETSQEQGAAAGWTWGLLRGLGHGFVRTAAGLYELVTFPVPAPAGYAPVIEPEYVFDHPSTS